MCVCVDDYLVRRLIARGWREDLGHLGHWSISGLYDTLESL